MLFYVSGEYNDAVLSHVVANRLPLLSSFAYDSWRPRAQYIASQLRGTGHRIKHFLDSGAFTTWSKGKAVDMKRLCDTCNRLQDEYGDVCEWTFVALDVIPGKPGEAITPAVIDVASRGTADNYNHMRKVVRGTVLPVFHVGDPAWLVKEYAGVDYVALGMSQAISEDERVRHAARNSRLFPGVRLHGLAATGGRMLRAAPWHSVDSSAWIYSAAMGGISIVLRNGKLVNIAVSEHSPKASDMDGHFTTMPATTQQYIRALVEAEGFTINKLATSYEARWLWNIGQYSKACERAAGAVMAHVQEGLFDA